MSTPGTQQGSNFGWDVLRSILYGVALVPVIAFIALCFLWFFGDTLSYRKLTVKRLEGWSKEYRSDPSDHAPLDKIRSMAVGSYRFGRCRAISVLGKLGDLDPTVTHELILGLQSEDPFVRDVAAQALSDMGTRATPAKEVLAKTLREYPNERTAMFSAKALCAIGDSSTDILDSLIECRNNKDCFDPKLMMEVYEVLSGKEMPQ